MKSHVFTFQILTLALLAFGTSKVVAQNTDYISIGVKGGVGLGNQYTHIDGNPNFRTSNNGFTNTTTLFNGGAYVEFLPKAPISFLLGASYRQKGFSSETFTGTVPNYIPSGKVTSTGTLNYFSVDATVRGYLTGGDIRPYVGAGIRLDNKIGSSASVTGINQNDAKEAVERSIQNDLDKFNNVNLSGLLNFGVKYKTVSLEFEWNPDITVAYKQDVNNIIQGNYSSTRRSQVFSLNLAVNLITL